MVVADLCYVMVTPNFVLFADMRNPKLSAEVAKELRKFHQVEVPGSKEPQLWHDISKFYDTGSFYS